MDAVGFQRKKSTAFVTRSTIVWSWSQKREDTLKIKNYYYSLIQRVGIINVVQKEES